VLLLNFVMHCIVSTIVGAFEMNIYLSTCHVDSVAATCCECEQLSSFWSVETKAQLITVQVSVRQHTEGHFCLLL